MLLVEQRRVDVEHGFRGPEGWERTVHTDPADAIPLSALGSHLRVAERYAGVDRLP